jgi:hypothetical protein
LSDNAILSDMAITRQARRFQLVSIAESAASCYAWS